MIKLMNNSKFNSNEISKSNSIQIGLKIAWEGKIELIEMQVN